MEQQVVIPPKKSSVLGTDLGFSLQAKLTVRAEINSPTYTFCVLDSHGAPKQFIVCGGTNPQMADDEIKLQLFSDDQQRLMLDTIQPLPTFHQSSQQIHPDDSIRTIKKKLIHELGSNNVCYEEIYLFSNHPEKIPLLAAYQQITEKETAKLGKGATRLERQLVELDNISSQLDKRTLGQFLFNVKEKETELVNKESYQYEDLLPIFHNKESMVSKPLGQRFAKNFQYLFSGNPFDILVGDGEPVFQRTKQNDLYVFENHLLMNYGQGLKSPTTNLVDDSRSSDKFGEIENNIIYVCLTKNVLDYATEMSITPSYLLDLYFPLIYKQGIINAETFEENHQNLIAQNRDLIKDTTIRLFDTIDAFYNIYNGRTQELPYLDRGIESFDIVLHPDFDVPLPLDIIFKQIHTTKTIPFIKYNPGLRRENMFRLYSEEIAKNGKKIPFLKKSQIFAISKQTGKLRQVSIFIQHETTRQTIDLFMDLEYNGNIRIRGNTLKPISLNDLETILYNAINPILIEINGFMERSGYTVALFDKLTDRNVEIMQLDYVCKINLKRAMKLKSYLGCLTSLFDITNTELDTTRAINMQFIRVDNYKKMTAISAMITEVFRRTNNQEEIINALIVNYSMDRDTALKEIVKYFNEHTRIQGQYVNKSVDVVDNPGFPVVMSKSPFDDKFSITVSNISSVDFINVLHIYFDSILRITQFPDTIEPTLLNKMSGLCSSKKIIVNEEDNVENVIAVAPLLAAPIVFDEEEEEEEEDDDKYLPEEDDDQVVPEDEQIAEPVAAEVEVPVAAEVEESVSAEAEESPDSGQGAESLQQLTQKVTKSPDELGSSGRFLPSSEQGTDGSPATPPSIKGGISKVKGGVAGEPQVPCLGGARKKGAEKKEASPKQEKSNIFTKRIKDREPSLILTKKQGKFSSYSRICPANVSLQPVILTDEEKTKIDEEHPGSYTNALQYGTDSKNPYWYICPRYWCLKNNAPMTEAEVAKGECGGKIIPDNAKVPPPGHFIYEFTDNKYHTNEKGEYVYHSPGFKPEHSHPDGKCLPCCYNKWSSYNIKNPSEQQRRREQCGLADDYVYTGKVDEKGERIKKVGPDGKPIQIATGMEKDIEDDKKDKKGVVDPDRQKKKINIFGVERIPIPQYRWGFLPLSIELFLHTDNSKFVVKNNPALIQAHKRPLLRYGVETSQHQSFVAVLADIYSYFHNQPLQTIAAMRETLANLLTLDQYIRLQNGSLASIFKPNTKKPTMDDMKVEKYANTAFYKSIELTVPSQYHFLQDTVASFENFLAYLKDADSMIDHTYLWDIISSNESPLFTGGLNMMILRIYDNDSTDNVELLCPTSAYSSNIYVKGRGTIVLLLHNDFYEPIYLYEDKDKQYPIPTVKIFTQNAGTFELKQMQVIFDKIMETTGKSCKPIHNRPRVYEYKENISAEALSLLIKKEGFTIQSQVQNYRGKIIGLLINTHTDDKVPIYLPCFPSNDLPNVNKIWIDSTPWTEYVTTRDRLTQISSRTKGLIRCKPLVKVVEDGLIVGIISETNQFIFVDPPVENTIEDGVPVLNATGYKEKQSFAVDQVLATSRGFDEERVNTVRNVALETQFYTSFRTIIRNLLNDYLHRDIRQQVIAILEDNQLLYTVKVKKIDELIRRLTRQSVQFVDEIDPEAQKQLANAVDCTTNCSIESFCVKKRGKICIPKKNMVSGSDNSTLYFVRVADELVRYKRIQLFMLEPRRYLNITNVDYSVNQDEVLMLASVLTDAYFDDLEPYNKNKYVKNITYENAEISRTNPFYQHYSNKS